MAFVESQSFAFGLHQKSVVEAVVAVAVAEGFGTCKEEMKFDGILDFCQNADVIWSISNQLFQESGAIFFLPDRLEIISKGWGHRHRPPEGRLLSWKLLEYWLRLR